MKDFLATLRMLDPARQFRGRLKRAVRLLLNWWIWLTTRLGGGSYTDFYERMMDRRARVGSLFGKSALAVTGTPDERRRRFAVEYFAAHGWITPTTTFLDYGCGGGATGVNFIRYLDTGRYTGADISGESLRRAREWVGKSRLADRCPTFVHLPGGSLAGLNDRTFDLIYAQDVVTHMPPDNIRALIREIARHMRFDGVFLMTFTYADGDCEYQDDLVNWHHNPRFFVAASAGSPLGCEEVVEWTKAGYKPGEVSRMVRFRLRPAMW